MSGVAAKFGFANADFSNIEAGNKGAIVLLAVVVAVALYVFGKFMS